MAFLKKYVIPPIVTIFYWIWAHTWRFRLILHPEFKALHDSGKQVGFAHWHGDNLVLVRLGRQFHIASLASQSSDGELITRVLKNFGFGIARGSSRRGGVHGLMNMISRVEEGFNPAIAVDGPKGPAHKVKPGIIYVAQRAGIQLVPVGVAKSSALVFNKAWDKTHFPWPFSKVIVSFGKPFQPGTEDQVEEMKKIVEERLGQEKVIAENQLSGGHP